MIDYHKIWSSINAESESSPVKSQIARRVFSKSILPVFLATDFKKGVRILYIKLYKDHDVITDKLPRFKGLDISLLTTSIGVFKNEEFIRFTQSIPNTNNIFEAVISDICENVIHIQNKQNLNAVLTKIISEWKVFFDKQENEILSVAAQKGLLGELYFLKEFLFHKYSFSESVTFWTGSDRTNHDFQVVNNSIEVKTTSGKQHRKFIVSSEKQLDNTGLEHLYLSVLAITIHSNMPNRTLPAFVGEIHTQIQNDPIASFQFLLKLAKYGYNEASAAKYTIGYSVSEIRFFDVTDGFPRLLQQNLPDEIGDLKYSVVIAACSPFEIKTNILNCI